LPAFPVRSLLLITAAIASAQSAAAQIPVREPEPSSSEAPPAAPLAESPEPPAAAPLPAQKPAAPLSAEPSPVAPPLPAKADHLSERHTDAADEDEYFEDDGGGTETPRRIWYGWQTLTADGISTAVFFAAFGRNSDGSDGINETLAWSGLLGYELAPGIVHFVHRNPGRAFASFGIRLGMPLAGAFLGGAAISGCSGDDCQATGIGIGFLLGMGGAIALDAALLAYDSPEPRRPAARLLPLVSVSRELAWLGVAGEL
jgi:hypothetical protein